jgi:hypothetical protein
MGIRPESQTTRGAVSRALRRSMSQMSRGRWSAAVIAARAGTQRGATCSAIVSGTIVSGTFRYACATQTTRPRIVPCGAMRRAVLAPAQRRLREGSVLVPLHASGRPPVRHNLRTPPYPFVGRTDELDKVHQRLSSSHPQAIISIAGLSTIGKSVLALTVAWKVVEEWTDLAYSAVAWIGGPSSIQSASDAPVSLPHPGSPRYLERIADIVQYDICHEVHPPHPVARTGSSPTRKQRIELALEALRGRGGVLLILDAVDALANDEVDELRELVRTLPDGCKAIATMGWDLQFGFPVRLPPVPDEGMDTIIDHLCQRHGVYLDPGLRHCVLTCAHGFVPVAERIIREIARDGPDEARARQNAPAVTWVPDLFADVFSTTIHRLGSEHRQSYDALHAMAQVQFAGNMCQGMTTTAMGVALGQDPQRCDVLLRPLLGSNLLTRLPSQTLYSMLPITRTYLRCA